MYFTFWVLFSQKGRISRKIYWIYFIIRIFFFFFLVTLGEWGLPLFLIFYLLSFWTDIAINVKRLHDTNRSGWYILLGLITMGIYLLVVCGFFKSTEGENKYGLTNAIIYSKFEK